MTETPGPKAKGLGLKSSPKLAVKWGCLRLRGFVIGLSLRIGSGLVEWALMLTRMLFGWVVLVGLVALAFRF